MLLYAIIIFPWVVFGLYRLLFPNPPAPKIIYGEFPFRLTYEVAGETKVIEDAVICKYGGVDFRWKTGSFRKWKSQLKSGNDAIMLLTIDDNTQIGCRPDWSPEYYMGDLENYPPKQNEEPRDPNCETPVTLFLIKQKTGSKADTSFISSAEAYEKFKLKIVDLEEAPPITNFFR